MSKIKMDEYGRETYDSLEVALDTWSELAAAEEGYATVQLDLEIESYDMNSSQVLFGLEELVSTEGIKEQVKNMASKASSNIVMWAKKFINFFFAWVINFLKGNVNIRKAIKASYDKAVKYSKGLSKLATAAANAPDDDKYRITVHAGHGVGPSALSTIFIAVAMLNQVVDKLNEVFNMLKNIPEEHKNEGASIVTDVFATYLTGVSMATFTSNVKPEEPILAKVKENFTPEKLQNLVYDHMSIKQRCGGQPYNQKVLDIAQKGSSNIQDVESAEDDNTKKPETVDFGEMTPKQQKDGKSDFEKVTGFNPSEIVDTAVMNTPVRDLLGSVLSYANKISKKTFKAVSKFAGSAGKNAVDGFKEGVKEGSNSNASEQNKTPKPQQKSQGITTGANKKPDGNNKTFKREPIPRKKPANANESYSYAMEAEEATSNSNEFDVNKVMDVARKVLQNANRQMQRQIEYDAQTVEVSYGVAYQDIRLELDRFIKLAQTNKDLWNFEKTAQGLESIRRSLTLAADKLQVSSDKEEQEAGKALFSKIVAVGNLTSQFTKEINHQAKSMKSSIDRLLVDGAKLGSKLTTLGGK